MKILNFDGKNIQSEEKEVEVQANSSQIYMKLPIVDFTKEDHLISARLVLDGKVLTSNIYYSLPLKDLQLPKPNIQKEILKTVEGYHITLKTDKLAKNVFLSINEDGHFSDNYFDLLPGEEKRLIFKSRKLTDLVEKDFNIISLVDTL